MFSPIPTCSTDFDHDTPGDSSAGDVARRRGILDRLTLGAAFAGAARRYWTGVFPRVRRERRHWRERAAEIPDPLLRALALQAEGDAGNLEGAAAFAAFVPRAHRAAVVRALVAYQSTYNYLDVLAEQPSADPVAGARGLHRALLDALELTGIDGCGHRGAGGPILDYYADYPQREDGGYLAELVRECRTALATLPSYAAVAPAARRATERIVEFQSLNLSEWQGEHDAFERWARAETPAGDGPAVVGDGGRRGLLARRLRADRRRGRSRTCRRRGARDRERLLPLDRRAALAARPPRRPRRGRGVAVNAT